MWYENKFMGKPKMSDKNMLKKLSNSTHEVITNVGFLQKQKLEIIHEVSKVTFRKISNLKLKNTVNQDYHLMKLELWNSRLFWH